MVDEIRSYEVTKSNVDKFLNKNIEVFDCSIIIGEGDFPLVDIILKSGDIIQTTSKVLARQFERARKVGFPMRCRIVKKKGKYPYYCLESPKQ